MLEVRSHRSSGHRPNKEIRRKSLFGRVTVYAWLVVLHSVQGVYGVGFRRHNGQGVGIDTETAREVFEFLVPVQHIFLDDQFVDFVGFFDDLMVFMNAFAF